MDNILAEIPREGESVEDVLNSVDKELQVEKPAESQTEKEELALPDETILKKNSAWEEMREAKEQAEKKSADLEARLSALERPDIEKSEFVLSLVGDNADVESKWLKEKQSLKEEVKREFIQDQINAEKKAQEEKDKWITWTNEKLSAVEKEYKVDLKTDTSLKNELSKIMLDYSPTDEQGNLDYGKGMKILIELNKAKSFEKKESVQVKKDIADATVSKETSTQKNKDYMTSQDFRKKDWRSWVHN